MHLSHSALLYKSDVTMMTKGLPYKYPNFCALFDVRHTLPFGRRWVEEESSFDDRGNGVADEGDEESRIGGRPGGKASQQPGSSSQQSHSFIKGCRFVLFMSP